MAYISRIQIENCRNVQKLDVDLSVESDANSSEQRPIFKHLIFTGPNGSGKSGVLAAIAGCIGNTLSARPLEFAQKRPPGDGLGDVHLRIAQTNSPRVWFDWTTNTQSGARALPMVARDIYEAKSRPTVIVYLPAHGRLLGQNRVSGPQKLNLSAENNRVDEQLSPYWQQFLVNKHTDMIFAKNDGDVDTADRIQRWFDDLRERLRELMEDPGLDFRYDRKSYTFVFTRSDGYEYDLNSLADGHAAVFGLLAEVFIRIELLQSEEKDFSFEPEGIVIIDEIEAHLHLSLQEQILPLLTTLFPKLQFIVATHSPAVIASISGAVVYDLKKQIQIPSDEYRGIPYGVLMTEHFGISSDIDLDSTQKLLRLHELAQKSQRSDEENKEFDQMSKILSSRSGVLATEVWMIKEKLSASSIQLARE